MTSDAFFDISRIELTPGSSSDTANLTNSPKAAQTSTLFSSFSKTDEDYLSVPTLTPSDSTIAADGSSEVLIIPARN